MMNMGNVRFENTYLALQECIEHVEDGKETSSNEKEYAQCLYDACKEFVTAYDEYGINEEEE